MFKKIKDFIIAMKSISTIQDDILRVRDIQLDQKMAIGIIDASVSELLKAIDESIGKIKEQQEGKTGGKMKATVKIMRSYNYNNFEISLFCDEEKTIEEVNQLRADCATLVDRAIQDYKTKQGQDADIPC